MKKKVEIVLLTGGSSGIGAETAKVLAMAGMKVYAGSRRGTVPEDCASSNNIIPLVMDVNDEQSVENAVNKIIENEGHIDALICNAGNGIAGPIEQTTTEEGKYQFETCFWGMHRTIKAVLPSMRANKFGRIITVSSVAAVVPIPYQAFYSSVKSAVLTYTKALSIELKPYGVQCCSVLPGDTKTGFTASRKMIKASSDTTSPYYEISQRSVARMEHDEQSGMPASKIGTAILRQLRSRKMSITSTPRIDYKAAVSLSGFLPDRFILWVVGKIYSK